ncbi:hypothetical protein TNCV_3147771 [Trichonephila clavipes]|nr:hypothetical protein TNCV_3147771 [Trichonephila clavipes]
MSLLRRSDFSHDGLLYQRAIRVGSKTRMLGADSQRSPIKNYWECERGPPRGFKELVWKMTRIFFIFSGQTKTLWEKLLPRGSGD